MLRKTSLPDVTTTFEGGQVRERLLCIFRTKLAYTCSNFVQSVNQQELTLQRSLDKLDVLKKALMQKYFG